MELRGFDSYPITLGDEMRGERASIGKSIEDAERDLRIKRRMLVAIESCDLEGFPNRSVVAGYVRSYARYLGMDAEDCYQRFCAESGYRSPVTMMLAESGAGGASRSGLPLLPGRSAGPDIAFSRFAAPPARSRFRAPVSLGAVTSTAALLALMAGLSYGGYALLQDIQRVGFAPIPEAPVVIAEAPLMTPPEVESGDVALPVARDYQDGGILAAVTPAPLQPIEALRRDGPISAIDPRTAGVFVADDVEQQATGTPRIDSADDAILAAETGQLGDRSGPSSTPAGFTTAARFAAATGMRPEAGVDIGTAGAVAGMAQGIALHASEDAWIRVRERDNVLFEGILAAGQQFELPARIDAPVLKAGNAGGIFVFVDGVAYGPLGQRGQIARNVSLLADDIRGSVPQAASLNIASTLPAEVHQRAEATAARQ